MRYVKDRKGISRVSLVYQFDWIVNQQKCLSLLSSTHLYGLSIARQGGLHVTGSYSTGGRSSRSLSGVYNADIGTTVRVASIRDEGHTFKERRTPTNDHTTCQYSITHILNHELTYHPALQHLRTTFWGDREESRFKIRIVK